MLLICELITSQYATYENWDWWVDVVEVDGLKQQAERHFTDGDGS